MGSNKNISQKKSRLEKSCWGSVPLIGWDKSQKGWNFMEKPVSKNSFSGQKGVVVECLTVNRCYPWSHFSFLMVWSCAINTYDFNVG